MITLTEQALEDFTKHVLAEYPKEACGLVIAGNYFACTNTHPEPTRYFKISAQERIEKVQNFGPVQAVLHSHPYDLNNSKHFVQARAEWPSVPDQAAFIADNAPWGIVSTDGKGISPVNWLTEEVQPIERRRFNWFSADCYTLIRDWHKLNTKLVLPNFTRQWMFWKRNTNTIEEGIMQIPYAKKYAASEAKIGDVAVFCISSNVVNHLAVITGPNEMLHQFCGAADDSHGIYAHTTRWDMWRKRARYVVRFEP